MEQSILQVRNCSTVLLSRQEIASKRYGSFFCFSHVGGQFGHDNNPQDQDLVHSYNTQTKKFDMLPKLPSQRSHAEPGTLEINGRLVIFGGREKAYPVHGDFVEFNPVAKTWEYLGKLPDGNWINPSVGFFRNVTRFGDTTTLEWIFFLLRSPLTVVIHLTLLPSNFGEPIFKRRHQPRLRLPWTILPLLFLPPTRRRHHSHPKVSPASFDLLLDLVPLVSR
jgi:hypothetical protein